MPWSLIEFYLFLPAFMLVMSRVAGLMLGMPLLSSAGIPMQIRILLAAAISLAVLPFAMEHLDANVTLGTAVVGMIGELAIGVLVGLGASLLLIGMQLAAQTVAQQAGLALGDIFNPLLESEGSPISELYFLIATMIFLAVGGDRAVVHALLESFQTVPPLAFRVTPGLVELVVEMLVLCFAIALRVGAPVILALMLSFLTLGFITRTVPQLNLLTIGFPIKIALALAIMAFTMMTLEPVVLDALTMLLDGIRDGLAAPPAEA